MLVRDVVEFIGKSRSKYKPEVKRYLENGCGDYCPITFVAKVKLGEEYTIGEYSEAARKLGIRKRDAESIVCAADDYDSTSNLRKKLCKAVGLKD